MRSLVRIWRHLTLPCEDIVRLVSLSLDGDLPRAERLAIKTHLVYCTACRRFRRQIVKLRDVIQRYDQQLQASDPTPSGALSEAARARIQRALTQQD